MKWNEMTDEMQVRLFWAWQSANEENANMTFEEFDKFMNTNFSDFNIFFRGE